MKISKGICFLTKGKGGKKNHGVIFEISFPSSTQTSDKKEKKKINFYYSLVSQMHLEEELLHSQELKLLGEREEEVLGMLKAMMKEEIEVNTTVLLLLRYFGGEEKKSIYNAH